MTNAAEAVVAADIAANIEDDDLADWDGQMARLAAALSSSSARELDALLEQTVPAVWDEFVNTIAFHRLFHLRDDLREQLEYVEEAFQQVMRREHGPLARAVILRLAERRVLAEC